MHSGIVVYAGMMGLLTACLVTGVIEHYRSGQTTMLLQLIVWPALGFCAVLCGSADVHGIGDGGHAHLGTRHERCCRLPPSASAPCCC